MHKRRSPKQDGDLGEVVGVHSLSDSESIELNAAVTTRRSRERERTGNKAESQGAYEKLDKRDVVCHHCGEKGHYAGLDCPYIDRPQTRRGQVAWAEFNQKSYNPRPAYDKNYYIERSRRRLAASSAASGTTSASDAQAVPRSKPSNLKSTSPTGAASKKKVTIQSEDRAPSGGRLKKVSGAPLSKKTPESDLDDEEEEAEEA